MPSDLVCNLFCLSHQVTPDEMDSYRRLIQKATQAQEPPSLTDESIQAFFSSLAQPSGIDSFAPDDFASAYSLAAMFPGKLLLLLALG